MCPMAYILLMNEDHFGALLSAVFSNGKAKIDGYKVIETLLELDRSGKLTEKERDFWIPPEYRCKKNTKGGN